MQYICNRGENRTTPRAAAVSLAIHPRFIVHRRRKSNSDQLNWWMSQQRRYLTRDRDVNLERREAVPRILMPFNAFSIHAFRDFNRRFRTKRVFALFSTRFRTPSFSIRRLRSSWENITFFKDFSQYLYRALPWCLSIKLNLSFFW